MLRWIAFTYELPPLLAAERPPSNASPEILVGALAQLISLLLTEPRRLEEAHRVVVQFLLRRL